MKNSNLTAEGAGVSAGPPNNDGNRRKILETVILKWIRDENSIYCYTHVDSIDSAEIDGSFSPGELVTLIEEALKNAE